MKRIKSYLKRTFLYDLVQVQRMKQWTTSDEEMLQFYSQFISADSLCFDVGANVGNRTKVFLRLGAKTVAIEPQLRNAHVLRRAFGDSPRLTVIPQALGATEAEAQMMIADSHVLSTLSTDWIEKNKDTGRFAKAKWVNSIDVRLTTLDRLIEQFGVPDFVKIDVEGYEYEVLKGLSRPVGALSIEFVPEFKESTIKCIHYLHELGHIQLNYALGEDMHLILQEWTTTEKMIEILSEIAIDPPIFGDVYIRFV
jgi:FkbM family methyltransferase